MKSSLRKRFGQRVKELRLASGISQEAFADECGFARSYVSRVERGIANPSLDAIQVFADGLGAPVAELFSENTPPPKTTVDLEVPFAKDGSFFNRSTFRPETKKFCVGEKGKGKTKYFDTCEAALAYLRGMAVAKWWRPNKRGNWGLVSAVRWGPSVNA